MKQFKPLLCMGLLIVCGRLKQAGDLLIAVFPRPLCIIRILVPCLRLTRKCGDQILFCSASFQFNLTGLLFIIQVLQIMSSEIPLSVDAPHMAMVSASSAPSFST